MVEIEVVEGAQEGEGVGEEGKEVEREKGEVEEVEREE